LAARPEAEGLRPCQAVSKKPRHAESAVKRLNMQFCQNGKEEEKRGYEVEEKKK
jgi:hypothetical protein